MEKQKVVDVAGSVFATIACIAIVAASMFGIGAIIVSVVQTIGGRFK